MSKLIESIINKDYTSASKSINEQIASIVERKMCEMKKMMAARDSEKDELTEAIKKKVSDPAKTAQQLALTMIARGQGRRVQHPPIKHSTQSDIAKESQKATRLHDAMRISAGQQAASAAARRAEWVERQRKVTANRIEALVKSRSSTLFPKQAPKVKDQSTLMAKLRSIVGLKNEELMLPSGKVMVATGETANQSVIKQRRGQV